MFKAHDIGYFFYNGGGDSADTCLKVSQLGPSSWAIRSPAYACPKTVDNDLPITDCCPGFGSVAKYVAVSHARSGLRRRLDGADLDQGVRAGGDGTARRLDRRGGRARRGKARRCAAHHPVSGNPFRPGAFLARVKHWSSSTAIARSSCPKACSDPDGKFLAEPALRDAFGHAQLGGVAPVIANMVKEKLKLQISLGGRRLPAARRAPHRFEDRRRPGLCRGQGRGRAGLKGRNAVMPTIVRKSDKPYRWTIGGHLDDVANVEKMMPRDFITEDGFGITAKCRATCAADQGRGLPAVFKGLPAYVRDIAARPESAAVKTGYRLARIRAVAGEMPAGSAIFRAPRRQAGIGPAACHQLQDFWRTR